MIDYDKGDVKLELELELELDLDIDLEYVRIEHESIYALREFTFEETDQVILSGP